MIGLCLGLLVFTAVSWGFGDPPLALAVVLSAVACAASIGMLLPWMLSRAGVDPAFGSGPLATIIQDVLSLVIYFAGSCLPPRVEECKRLGRAEEGVEVGE